MSVLSVLIWSSTTRKGQGNHRESPTDEGVNLKVWDGIYDGDPVIDNGYLNHRQPGPFQPELVSEACHGRITWIIADHRPFPHQPVLFLLCTANTGTEHNKSILGPSHPS
jgi:hypothetical protein